MFNRYTQTLYGLLLSLSILMSTRLWLYFRHINDFSDLSFGDFFLALFTGLRLDIMIVFTWAGAIIFFLIWPARFTFNLYYRKILGLLWAVVIVGITLVNIGDILYFDFVHRHVAQELSVIGNDIDILVQMALHYYLPELIASIIFSIFIVYLFYRLFKPQIKKRKITLKEYSIPLLVSIVLVLGIRGNISGKSFAISDAFVVNKMSFGNLALNGFFCLYRSGGVSQANHDHIPLEAAVARVKQALTSPAASFSEDPEYPLMRSYTKSEKKPHNIVIIMFESLSAGYVDSFSANDYGVTPNFDTYAGKGLKFTNFYANGQRSLAGITALMTGITKPEGLPPLGEGLELSRLSYLGRLAAQNGYDSLAIQSSRRDSFKIDAIMNLAGFKQFYGAEDIPKTGDEVGAPNFGVYDGDMLRFMHKKINTLKVPFISFAFTATTHAPYFSPGKKWEKYPQEPGSRNGFLNTVSYVDAMLGEFMQAASKEPWFDNTIFIFTADHVLGIDARKEKMNDEKVKKFTALDDFHIPLVIYAPKIMPSKTIDRVGSQADLFPTIIYLLGWRNQFASLSNSLLDEKVQERFAFLRVGSMIGIITAEGMLKYNFSAVVYKQGSEAALKEMEYLLKAFDTAEAGLIESNRWVK
jgi:phosphoglycerol transferase MdoB-like AlkP superfamily enzyme